MLKRILLFVMTLALSHTAFALKITDKIDSLDIGRNGEPHLVKLQFGRVAFIEDKDRSLLELIKKSMEKEEWMEFTLDRSSGLKSVKVVPTPPSELRQTHSVSRDPYVPSVVTLTKAQNIFAKMRRDYKKDGQCFNRAHVWTYEEYMRSKTNLNKVFLFFTTKYIRTYRFGWWFHVTPMVYVGGTGNTNMRMLDRRYTSGPLTSKTWTDVFIKSKATCKLVTKYSTYFNNQRTQDCYLIKASMYYVVPSDLARLEETGEERTEYDEVDVSHAYWEAFLNQPAP